MCLSQDTDEHVIYPDISDIRQPTLSSTENTVKKLAYINIYKCKLESLKSNPLFPAAKEGPEG